MPEVPDTVDVALDALSSPTSGEVSAATEGFSAREIAAAGAARALGGGGGGSAPFEFVTVTVTAAEVAARWDEDTTSAYIESAELSLEVGDDLLFGYRPANTLDGNCECQGVFFAASGLTSAQVDATGQVNGATFPAFDDVGTLVSQMTEVVTMRMSRATSVAPVYVQVLGSSAPTIGSITVVVAIKRA